HLAAFLLRPRGADERDGETARIEELLHAGPQRREFVLPQRFEQREEERGRLGSPFRVQALAEKEKRARRRAGRAQDAPREVRGTLPERVEERRQHPAVVFVRDARGEDFGPVRARRPDRRERALPRGLIADVRERRGEIARRDEIRRGKRLRARGRQLSRG